MAKRRPLVTIPVIRCEGCGKEIDMGKCRCKFGTITGTTSRPLDENGTRIKGQDLALTLCAECYWQYVEPLNELYAAREAAIEAAIEDNGKGPA